MLKLPIMFISNILQKLNSRDTRLIPQLPKLNKKIKFLSILIAFAFLTLIGRQILAADEITADNSAAIQKYQEKQTAISAGNNQESWMSESMMSNAMSLNQAIVGNIPTDVLKGKTTTWVPGGIIGITNQSIAYLYNPPASGVQYIAQTVNNFLGKPAYAATGYEGLKGIQNIWKSFRNAVYILFSVVFIGIGIAIMLRVKISQNAVITIQSAIPQLITSLILVTFSFAIAGLLIDLSYLFSGVVMAILFNSKGGLNSALWSTTFNFNPSFSEIVSGGTTFKLLYNLVPFTAIAIIPSVLAGVIGGFITLASGGAALPVGIAIAGISFILILLIILLVILVQIVKFAIGMAKCYITLLLKIILAPLEIGMGAIPNSKMNFSSWIWGVIANLAVFPISIIFLVLVGMILDSIDGGLWSPPMMGLGYLLKPIIGISAIMMLSQLPKMIPEFVFNIKPSPWGKALGESFKPGASKFAGRIGAESGADYIRNADTGATAPRWAKAGGYVVKAAEKAGIIKESR